MALDIGDSIPELRVIPDKYLPHRYAGASGDFNPIHIDTEFARRWACRATSCTASTEWPSWPGPPSQPWTATPAP